MNHWSGKVVLVAGGSKGLGLEIARAFGNQGALPILLARNSSDLESAAQSLASDDIESDYVTADATDWDSVNSAIQGLIQKRGDLNVLVNAIGKSTRADIENLDLTEAEELLDINYLTALRCVKSSLPSLKKTRGHIVNIGSLSSKTAWPFMTPYTASKFALAGFTHQLRIEIEEVHSMLVCPGPIKREDAGSRYESQSENLPEAARKPGGGAKLKGICPRKLAAQIVKGCEKRKAEIIMPWKTKILFVLSSISTRWGDWLLKKNASK